jgi:hypothetical protein
LSFQSWDVIELGVIELDNRATSCQVLEVLGKHSVLELALTVESLV